MQCYQNGLDPTSFYTPPPPQNVQARVDGTGTNVTITWNSGGGPVTNYVIEAGDYGYGDSSFYFAGQVGPSTFTFTTTTDYSLPCTSAPQPAYRVHAYFDGGTDAVSQSVAVSTPDLTLTAFLVRGAGANLYLIVSALPASVTTLQLLRDGGEGPPVLDIPASNIVNGVLALSGADIEILETYPSARWLQPLTASGAFGVAIPVGPGIAQEDFESAPNYLPLPFVNASRHLKENLKFLLRSATMLRPFTYFSDVATPWLWAYPGPPYSTQDPESYYVRPASSTNYAYYGFHTFSPDLDYSLMDPVRPIQENFLWSNFVFDPANYTQTGAGSQDDFIPGTLVWTLESPLYQYSGSGTESSLPVAFTNADSQWFYYQAIGRSVDYYVSQEIGISTNSNRQLVLSSDARNCYGLSFNSAKLTLSGFPVLEPGTPSSFTEPSQTGCYFDTAIPTLQTVDYYFASQTPYFRYGSQPPPLPGSPDFTTTTTSPLLITGFSTWFDQLYTVAGWAKQAIGNGYEGEYAYLEQYFDSAYVIDGNGNVTTNSAGLLSPYGEFSPMQPGPAALVTLPDIDTGQQGTGVVSVIKLQLDVNHDGIMDLSFAGPDNTSQARPFVFWINNDRDVPPTTGLFANPLDHDVETIPTNSVSQDWYQGNITCARGLEDFARLWICGVPSLPANQGYTATLSCIALSGAPAINLYTAEAGGGIGYLTNTTVAQSLVGQVKLVTIATDSAYQFPGNFFDGSNKYFLFEGAGTGEGQFVLTVYQGTNVIAQTSAYIDLHDVKDLYEQAHITNVTSTWPAMVEQTTTSGFKVDKFASAGIGDEQQLIIFVHGWRLGNWAYHNFSETMFKRLYWQGFQGRFAAPYWPTLPGGMTSDDLDSYLTFNPSEHIALTCGAGVAGYLLDLKSRFPDCTISVCSHSQGATVMAEALRQLAATNQAPIQNYVLMQGAFPANSYDTTVTNYPDFIQTEQVVPTPNSYLNYAQGIRSALQGNIINFFNTNDFALAQMWNLNNFMHVPQTNGYLTMKPSSLLGYQTDGTNSWRVFNGASLPVTNTFEIMAFVARSRSLAVGEQPGVGGQVNGGELDLAAQFSFSDKWYDHSGEFNQAIQAPQGSQFYTRLLKALRTGGL